MRQPGLLDMRTGGRAAQAPIQSHRQAASDGHFRHPPAPPELQALVHAPQFRIEPRRPVAGLHQQPTQHFVALLTDMAEPLMTAAGVFAGIQPQITDQLATVRKALHRTHGEHKGQGRHWPHALLLHQPRCLGPPPPRQRSHPSSFRSNTLTPQGGYDVPFQSHSWPESATGSAPRSASSPACHDASTVAGNPAPPASAPRHAGNACSPAGPADARHPAYRSSAAAPPPPVSPPDLLPTTRAPTPPPTARTIACIPSPPSRSAPASPTPDKTFPPLHLHAPDDVS